MVLLYENFNNCSANTLPPGWSLNLTGNQNPVWYIGIPQNNDSDSMSMDGSCCLIIDDDATGDNTPAYVADFISPAFDCSQFSTIYVGIDVHYRDWNQANESLQILATDGVNTFPLAVYNEDNSTGEQFHEYVTLRADLGLLTNAPNVRLIFRYDDGSGFNWWAGIDNVVVAGIGAGTKVLVETFNDCQKPAGWETEILSGEDDWQFGKTNNGNANPSSMNGSCFAFFDDDVLGSQDTTPSSRVRMYSPWFTGSTFSEYKLAFDIIHRDWKEASLSLWVQNGDGEEKFVAEALADVGGPQFDNFESAELDLTPFRHQQMRLVFEFWDGNEWGWWAGLDNIKVMGIGQANDLCANAIQLSTGANCTLGENRTAVFEGPAADCTPRSVGSKWYKWQADFTGLLQVSTNARFNDVVNIYKGGCANLNDINCTNRDEHGFTGEKAITQVVQGQNYLIRVSGAEGGFGEARGDFCIKLDQIPAVPTIPANDNCVNATTISVDAACLLANNLNGIMSANLPSQDTLARADIWFKFTAPTLNAGEKLQFLSNANFSDVITVYKNGCNNLQEIAGTHLGQRIDLENLTAGQTYRVQVAGNFATAEGTVCAQIKKTAVNPPSNDDCVGAKTIQIGGQCSAAENVNAGFSGHQPPCVIQADKDVWFKFIAPPSGNVRINSGADFEHVVAIWSGPCNNLQPVFCAENPLRCDGYTIAHDLMAGQTYYLQVASWSSASGYSAGDVCVKLLDANNQPDFQPLDLKVVANCTGINTAQLEISAENGLLPYYFSGNTAAQTLNSGDTYVVIVTDAMGCAQAVNGVVPECTSLPCAMVATIAGVEPTCNGLTNGSLAVITTGSGGNLQYQWSNPSFTGSSPSNIGAGSYSVTITDSNGCSTVANIVLNQPAALAFTAPSITQPIQGQSNGAIQIQVNGGTTPYIYAWSRNGTPFSNSPNLQNIAAGNYNLIVTDANNCTVSTGTIVLNGIVSASTADEAFFANISPNPAVDQAILSIKLPVAQDLQMQMQDNSGKVLWSRTWKNVTESTFPLDLKDLPSGIYEVKIVVGNDVVTRKLAVVK